MQKIPLLIVTSRTEDVAELSEILRDTSWVLTDIPNVEEAGATLKAAAAPILLFDRDAGEARWQDSIKRLLKSRRNACVVLLSSVADQYLWEEVVQQGGFDLLA